MKKKRRQKRKKSQTSGTSIFLIFTSIGANVVPSTAMVCDEVCVKFQVVYGAQNDLKVGKIIVQSARNKR
jgi:hypothetical protein